LLNAQSITDFDTVTAYRVPLGSVTSSRPKDFRKVSYKQAIGTQGKLIDAALIAQNTGRPINRLITIRTAKLKGLCADGIFLGDHEADATKDFMELLRHWHTKRNIPYTHIWTREYGAKVQEHLHIGLHSADVHDTDFCNQMVSWTGERQSAGMYKHRGEIALSEHGSWQVKSCTRAGMSGVDVAIYLAKDEPTFVQSAWGKSRPNHQKRVARYKVGKGRIEGLKRHEYRHGISRNIAPTSAIGMKVLKMIGDDERKIRNLPY
jgi:hypothetical protein